MAADCQKKLQNGPLPQLETCIQRMPVHVCHANGMHCENHILARMISKNGLGNMDFRFSWNFCRSYNEVDKRGVKNLNDTDQAFSARFKLLLFSLN